MPEDFEKIVLENGFRIIFEQRPGAKSCSMGVWVGSGSCYEEEERAGISHFIEHMLFKGTRRRSSQEIARASDAMGGELNAYTDRESTCFYTRVLSGDAPEAFELIADMLTSPRLDNADIELEKGVIIEEIAMYESNPADLCLDLFYLTAFPNNALGRNILGRRETVRAMSAEALREHMRRFYSPQRMVACFVGAFDRDRLLEKCMTYFSTLKPAEAGVQSVQTSLCPNVLSVKRRTEQNQVVIGFPSSSLCHEDRYAFQLLSSMLGGQASSRLFRTLREEQGLVYSVDSYLASYLGTGVFTVSLGVSPRSEREAVRCTARILGDLASDVTQQELDLAASNYLSGLLMALESSSVRAGRLGTGELLLGKALSERELESRIRAVTLEDIISAARQIGDFSRACICAVGKTAGAKFYNDVARGLK